ncbi:hypothetical protein GGF46_002600 [Coemansia sp. RSA 552]|nr:hypothetical protein GGF46_002600 [Coemansia sp. RSA 552]
MEYMQRVIAEIGSAFVQFAGMLMHQATTSLLLENIPLPVLQGACSNLTLLRELVIWDTECQPEAVSLAKHHAETLEKLVIGYMRPQQMLDLVWTGGVETGQTYLYPRLKHFHLRCCEDQLEYAHPKSLTNPFPVLKVFINEDTLPYAALVILDGNRSRLCHLQLDLDWSGYQWLIDKGILAKNAFANLHFVSLLCPTYNEYEWGNDLACLALGLCRTIRSVHLHHVYGDDISDTLSLLNSLNDLRILDMGSANITLDQAISILCASTISHHIPQSSESNVYMGAI